MSETRQLYRSIDDYLGPGDTRFFASGFRRAEYDVTGIAVHGPGNPGPGSPGPGSTARIGIGYPSNWSTKAERTDLRPHLSTIDLLVLSVQLAEMHLMRTHGLDAGQRRVSWLRKVSLRAGKVPQENLRHMEASAVPAGPGPVPFPDADGMWVSAYDCAVGVMRARCEIVHPAGNPVPAATGPGEAGYRSVEEALGPAAGRYYGDGFKSRRQVITDVAVDMSQTTATADVRVAPATAGAATPAEGIEGGFQPSFTMVDAFVSSLQLGQVLLYELDSIPREQSNTLWMVRTVLESAGPLRLGPGPVPARMAIGRKQLLPLRGGMWRTVDFTGDCGGVALRSSFAHEVPRQRGNTT
jgi:hypothetical protein